MIQKKAGVAIGFLFLIILFLGFVSAANPKDCDIRLETECQTDPWNNIVMGLSGPTNAHGQTYDATPKYDYVLCCNFDEGAEGRICTTGDETNKIVQLSSTTNAHAETADGTAYPTDVCYSDLECIPEPSGVCPGGKNEMIRLSGETNAHIGPGDDPNYDVAVCCDLRITFCGDGIVQDPNGEGVREKCDNQTAGSHCIAPAPDQPNECTCEEGYEPKPFTNYCRWLGNAVVYWSNESSADLVRISDLPNGIIVGQTTVYAIFEEFFLGDGIPITFTIKENDILIDDTLRTIETTILDGVAIAEWTITYEDIQNANQGGEETEYEFYFEYSYSQGSGDSGILTGSVVEAPVCQAITMCMDYRVQDQCEGDLTRCNVSATSVEANTNIDCDDLYIDCECWWNESDGGQCGSRWISTKQDEEGICSYTTITDDDCEDMLLTYTYLATWTPANGAEAPDTCQTGYTSVPCATKVQLPFFNIYNLIVVIVVIVLIYLALNLKKKKKPVRSKKKRKKK